MRQLAFFIFLLGLAFCSSCGDSDDNPGSPLVLQAESAHYNYYYVEEDNIALDTEWMEQHYNWATGRLGVYPNTKLNYYKYQNRAHLSQETGQNTNGFAEIGTWNFHSIWHPEGHENIHTIVINTIGHPPALFNEGIAVALAPQPIYGKGVFNNTPTWNGEALDVIARRLKNGNNLPQLSSLLESTSFFTFDTGNTYPMAGAFCSYLLANYSVNDLKTFFAALNFESTATDVETEFMNSFGVTIEHVWNEWVNQL